MKKKHEQKKKNGRTFLIAFIFLEIAIFLGLITSILLPNIDLTLAAVGQDNVTVVTLLQIGNVPPEVLNVSINNDATGVDLTANATTEVNVYVIARDFNGDGDIANITGEFFDQAASSYGAADDNNNHYTNTSCVLDTTYGDQYEASANCTFQTQYYANNATWNATIQVTDNASLTDQGSDNVIVNILLALGLPDNIDYGEVNATEVSSEILANVTNMGNSQLNLTLSGYAVTEGDGNAMNCTLGSTQNISIGHEKYNLTASNTGVLTLGEFEGNYTNLTATPTTKLFDLIQRQNDSDQYVDDTNATYWRIYVPIGVAGTCSGNIIFGAVQATGS